MSGSRDTTMFILGPVEELVRVVSPPSTTMPGYFNRDTCENEKISPQFCINMHDFPHGRICVVNLLASITVKIPGHGTGGL